MFKTLLYKLWMKREIKAYEKYFKSLHKRDADKLRDICTMQLTKKSDGHKND